MFSRTREVREDRVVLEHHVGRRGGSAARPDIGCPSIQDLAAGRTSRNRPAGAAASSCRSPTAPAARRTRLGAMSKLACVDRLDGPVMLGDRAQRDEAPGAGHGATAVARGCSPLRRSHLGEGHQQRSSRCRMQLPSASTPGSFCGKRSWLKMKTGSVGLVAGQEGCDHIFVERGAEAEQQAGHDAGPGQRKGHAQEGLPGVEAEIGEPPPRDCGRSPPAARSCTSIASGTHSMTCPSRHREERELEAERQAQHHQEAEREHDRRDHQRQHEEAEAAAPSGHAIARDGLGGDQPEHRADHRDGRGDLEARLQSGDQLRILAPSAGTRRA